MRARAKPIADALKKLGDDVYELMKESDTSRDAIVGGRCLLRRIGTPKMYTGGVSWDRLRRDRAEREAANN